MCGVGEKADRRPIDPPPIVQLKVRLPGNGPTANRSFTSYLQNPYYFMHASLIEKDSKEDVHLIKDNKTKATTGSAVSSLYPLKDIEGSGADSGFFIFPDLSVRMEGTYRLKFCLYEMVGKEVHYCSSVISAPLTVYSAKKFPGMEESTTLSQSFAEQGLKIRIRKEVRPKKRRRGPHTALPAQISAKGSAEGDIPYDSQEEDELEEGTPPATKRKLLTQESASSESKKSPDASTSQSQTTTSITSVKVSRPAPLPTNNSNENHSPASASEHLRRRESINAEQRHRHAVAATLEGARRSRSPMDIDRDAELAMLTERNLGTKSNHGSSPKSIQSALATTGVGRWGHEGMMRQLAYDDREYLSGPHMDYREYAAHGYSRLQQGRELRGRGRIHPLDRDYPRSSAVVRSFADYPEHPTSPTDDPMMGPYRRGSGSSQDAQYRSTGIAPLTDEDMLEPISTRSLDDQGSSQHYYGTSRSSAQYYTDGPRFPAHHRRPSVGHHHHYGEPGPPRDIRRSVAADQTHPRARYPSPNVRSQGMYADGLGGGGRGGGGGPDGWSLRVADYESGAEYYETTGIEGRVYYTLAHPRRPLPGELEERRRSTSSLPYYPSNPARRPPPSGSSHPESDFGLVSSPKEYGPEAAALAPTKVATLATAKNAREIASRMEERSNRRSFQDSYPTPHDSVEPHSAHPQHLYAEEGPMFTNSGDISPRREQFRLQFNGGYPASTSPVHRPARVAPGMSQNSLYSGRPHPPPPHGGYPVRHYSDPDRVESHEMRTVRVFAEQDGVHVREMVDPTKVGYREAELHHRLPTQSAAQFGSVHPEAIYAHLRRPVYVEIPSERHRQRLPLNGGGEGVGHSKDSHPAHPQQSHHLQQQPISHSRSHGMDPHHPGASHVKGGHPLEGDGSVGIARPPSTISDGRPPMSTSQPGRMTFVPARGQPF